jgi:hypothetical protein
MTAPIEIAARVANAIRIGTRVEELLPPEVPAVDGAGVLSPGFEEACWPPLEPLPGLPWPVPPPLPLPGDEPDREDELPGPPEPPLPDGAKELWASEFLLLGIVVDSGW